MSDTLKQIVHRLYSDQSFRAGFLSAPDKALAGEGLSEAERRACSSLRLRLAASTTLGTSAVPMDGGWP